MYIQRPNILIKTVLPGGLTWDLPNAALHNRVFFTFDDGPHPEATPFVLEALKQYDAQGTFFCIGNNVLQHGDIYQQILQDRHSVGNHTFQHLNGWKTKTDVYLQDVAKAAEVISSKLFRPPYGRIKRMQAKQLLAMDYKIVMWNWLMADFDTQLSPQDCLQKAVFNLKPGDVIVFHDSEKAMPRLTYCLPRVLEFIRKQNWTPHPL